MRYMLLLHLQEAADVATNAPTDMAPWERLHQEFLDAGVDVETGQLQAAPTARTVRVRDGQVLVTDGPFTETKEILGGYAIIDVDSQTEAERWAAKVPVASYGVVEVRRIADLPVTDAADDAGLAAATGA